MSAALSRRGALKIAAAATGGLVVAVGLGGGADAAAAPFAPNAFVRIDRDGRVTLVMPNQEMGQGIYTAHSQILAEELDIPMAAITLQAAPADDDLYGGERKRQGTGGSSSIRAGFYPLLRQAGAAARALLVTAAAQGWGVDPATLRTADARVFDDANNRSAAYGMLVDRAARLPAPTQPAPLKSPRDFKIIGKPVHRLDTPAKTNGSAQYGIDVFAGQCKVASVIQAPVVGATLKGIDQSAAMAISGVTQVVVLDDLVAVVGDHSWAAIAGANALKLAWNPGPNAGIGSPQIWRELREASTKKGVNAFSVGQPDQALKTDDRIVGDYEMPFLAHAPMEPLNCTVEVRGGACEIWTGTQVQTRARAEAAKAAGLEPEQVTVNNYMLGGAFGRRLDVDMIANAVRVAKHVDGKVKVMWTREQDMRNDMLRPVYRNVMAATLKDGRLDAWSHKVAAASVGQRMSGKPPKDGLDKGSVDGATELLYAVPHQSVDYVQSEPRAVNVGYWRGVGPNNTIFAIESFIDECAKKAGQDPVAFRLKMLEGSKAVGVDRAARCLRLVADKSGWSGALGNRAGRGVALQNVFGSYLATVAEAEVDDDGFVFVRRFTCALDLGTCINPDGAIAQMEGGLIYGLSAALWGNIEVENGQIVQSNFHDYRVLRIHEAPQIAIHILRSDENPGGVGEPGVTAVAPSVANAVAAATGIRLRRMPIDRDLLAGRKQA